MRCTYILALAGFGVLTAPAATITAYVSQAAWLAAVGPTVVEPFNGAGLQAFTGRTTSVGVIANSTGLLSGSVWHDRLTNTALESTTFRYLPGPIFAAGAFWDTSPGGEGQGLVITLNLTGGGTQVVSTLGPIDNGFFGWTSSAAFDSFRITAGTNVGVAETFEMDNLAFVVPEPGTFLLAAAGLCLVGLRKKILLTYCKIRT